MSEGFFSPGTRMVESRRIRSYQNEKTCTIWMKFNGPPQSHAEEKLAIFCGVSDFVLLSVACTRLVLKNTTSSHHFPPSNRKEILR